jgi:ribosomal protein L34E
MDTTTDTCTECGATLTGVERKRGTCHGCKRSEVTK